MKTKILIFSAVVTAFLAVSCNKETANVADSKTKTEDVSFSVGISQEETKAFVERESINTWKVVWNNSDKIWVKATDGSGAVLSSAEFAGGPQNVFKGKWTYPEEEATYSVFYPSLWGGEGTFDLRHQEPYSEVMISYPGEFYALRGDVKGVKAGEFPESISLRPLVALIQVFPDGEIELTAKDSKGAYVTGIDPDGKVVTSSDISWQDAVLFSTKNWGQRKTKPGIIRIVVPAGEKLTFYNGNRELRATKDSGLKAGTITNLFYGDEVKISVDVSDVVVSDYSATVNGKVNVEGYEGEWISGSLYYSETKDDLLAVYPPYYKSMSNIPFHWDEKGCFSVTIPDLIESRTYYFTIKVHWETVNYSDNYYIEDIMSFTTLEPKITVETRAPKFVGFNEAELDSYVITSTSEGPGTSFRYSSTASTREELIASGKGCFSKLTGLEKGTTYYYIAVGRAGSGRGGPYKYAYGDVMSFTTFSSEAEVGEAVDLGLSVLWRSCNVGALLPLSVGKAFCWGETSEPLSGEKYNKYRGDGGKEVLDLEDDAAHYVLGGKWRMPTYAEIEEMKSKCTITATMNNSSDGTPSHFIIRSNVPGHTDKYIMVPAVGNTEAIPIWTSSLVPEAPYNLAYVCGLSAYPTGFNFVSALRNDNKCYIRPVCDREN